jgi:hypothetical protein
MMLKWFISRRAIISDVCGRGNIPVFSRTVPSLFMPIMVWNIMPAFSSSVICPSRSLDALLNGTARIFIGVERPVLVQVAERDAVLRQRGRFFCKQSQVTACVDLRADVRQK